uniref:Putative protease n=1 Tax=viral metagenome TaxID=1070528 RepID=A0A6M3JH10_9ZZZZ
MLYPRTTNLNCCDVLVEDSQMTGYKEHMTQEYRTLYLDGVITGDSSPRQLLGALDTLSQEPIKLFITSPGGDLDTTFLFYDVMKRIKSPIITIGDYCASAAAILLAAGSKRYLSPHAKVMLHLPAGQMGGDARDWDIQHKQMGKYRSTVVDILRECGVKKSSEEILADIDRDYWMEPEEAIAYGLCDEIMTKDVWQNIIGGNNDNTL